jgi:hypothetical protein
MKFLSVRERALKVFSKIEGMDDVKEMMLRSLVIPFMNNNTGNHCDNHHNSAAKAGLCYYSNWSICSI